MKPADMNDYSQKDLVGVALKMTRRKEGDYRQLASEIARYHNLETAKIFESLADEEGRREQAIIKKWQNMQDIDASLPETALHEEINGDNESVFPFYLSPHSAVCSALEHERKAFDFFTNLAAHAPDRTTRETAEYFAKAEISHIAGLRLARIKASRQLREFRQSLGWWPDPNDIEDIKGLHHCLAAMEAALASLYVQAAEILMTLGKKEGATTLKRLADEAACHASDLNPDVTKSASSTLVQTDEPLDILLRTLKITDQALELTFVIAETSVDSEALELATSSAEKLSHRINVLSTTLGKVTGKSRKN
jgi:rubrerythrin